MAKNWSELYYEVIGAFLFTAEENQFEIEYINIMHACYEEAIYEMGFDYGIQRNKIIEYWIDPKTLIRTNLNELQRSIK